jgi:hypothetical protein
VGGNLCQRAPQVAAVQAKRLQQQLLGNGQAFGGGSGAQLE